jgi:hypothetical protein
MIRIVEVREYPDRRRGDRGRRQGAKDVEGWDSFKQVEIIVATQEAFGVKLTSREIDS